jgi:signal transduction histidine kinase/CheY-like chemotaxis protein/HPt (histidine-containing phosphotransfer) domain-containing protein
MIRKQVIRENIPQISFVCLAFVLMAFVSYFALSEVVEKNLSNIAEESLRAAEAQIRNGFSEMESAIVNTSFNVEAMLRKGESLENIAAYLAGTADWMKNRASERARFLGVYGYIRGNFLDGIDLNPVSDFIPQKTSWYQLAIRSAGKTVFTAPYPDERTGKMIISTARQVYDDDSQPIGIIALDVDISFLDEGIDFLSLAEGGYGMITNQYLSLISYPEKNEIGHQLNELAPDYNRVSDALLRGVDVIAERIRDARGDPVIVFFRRLFNGWHVAVVTPYKSYYSDVRYTAVVLSILGSTLAFILCCLLIRLSAARIRSDEENKSKSSFLARMSHEIRTPMNAIIGMSELALREEISPPSAIEYISGISQAGHNLLSIINDILDFSKIESGLLQIEKAPYKMASVLNDVISVIRTRIAEKHMMFLVDVDPRIPGSLCGDSARLRQILMNLLSNAVKYTQEGFVRLTVKEVSKNNGEVILNFMVSDSGIGIKPEDQERLFGDFVRIDTERNSGIEGTGLGLSITRSLCRAMGGDVSVTSVYGHGSEFTAALPQALDSAEAIASVNDREKLRVLLYHECPQYAESISGTLESLGVAFHDSAGPHEFRRELEDGGWTHAFVTSEEADAARVIITKNLLPTKIVLLADIGDSRSPSGFSSLMMPAWVISVANALNGVFTSSREKSFRVRFIAPKARILVVDDIATNLQVASGLLSPYRVITDTCQSGSEALKLVARHEYDMVLMDHMMPVMDGIEAAKRIRELGGVRFARLPIIALTANAISGMREKFLQNGFDDYLAKPIEISRLNAVMEKWLPKEKRLKSVPSAAKDDPASAPLAAEGADASRAITLTDDARKYLQRDSGAQPFFAMEIEGLDASRGLSMTGGTVEGYINVLETYCHDVEKRLEVFSSVPDEKSVALFTTYVHAIKSASASIGAAEISRSAAELEEAGIRGDIAAISEKLDGFREALSLMVERVRAALASKEPDDFAGAEAAVDRPALLRLKEALEREDIGAADSVLDDLKSKPFGKEVSELLSEISDCLLLSDFSAASEITDKLLEGAGR